MSKIILGLFLGIVIGLFAGYFITIKFLTESIPKDYVRVTVENRSGQSIKTLILKHESGSIEMKNLSDKADVNLIFKNVGENSYHIIAKFDNDSTVSSKGNYVEAGYRATEIIFADCVKAGNDKY
jgi:flagellar hook assembly protein FlgD